MDVLTLPGMEAQLDPLSEAQLKSAEARKIFEATDEPPPWMDDYWRLTAKGWKWRHAIYIIWAALPTDERQPKTQMDLAIEVLGLTTDRQIREWKDDKTLGPAMELEITQLRRSILQKGLSDVYQALFEAASKPSGRTHSDRKLYLEMAGEYIPKQKLLLGRALPDDLSDLSEEDLRALAAGTPEVVDE
jgi:hypothetical protein